jgi:hypothetical protein
MPKRIDNLDDHTVQGIWEASLAGELVGGDQVEDRVIRSAGVLAGKGYWNWMFQVATEDGSAWQDLRGNYWEVDPESGDIREWSSS